MFFSTESCFHCFVLKKELVWFRIQQSLDPNLVLSESVTLVMEEPINIYELYLFLGI